MDGEGGEGVENEQITENVVKDTDLRTITAPVEASGSAVEAVLYITLTHLLHAARLAGEQDLFDLPEREFQVDQWELYEYVPKGWSSRAMARGHRSP